jgi:hypothetical protein
VPEQQHVSLEPHYTVAQVAAAWGVSTDTVRRIFAPLPGVLKLGSRKPRKRKYVTLSIPERIVKAQHALLTKGESN